MFSGVCRIGLNYALSGSEFHRESPGTPSPTVNICALSPCLAWFSWYPGRQLPHAILPPGLYVGSGLGETASCPPEIKGGFVFDPSKGLRSRSYRKSLLPCRCHQSCISQKNHEILDLGSWILNHELYSLS